jgi:hypothetical protein
LLANLANALFASAILYTSNFFFTESPVSLAASINSFDKNLTNDPHFLFLAAVIIHLDAKNNCLFGFTS